MMNFFKRALLNIKERKGRAALQFIVFTVVCAFVLSGFAIQSATTIATKQAREKLGSTVTLSVDREKQQKKMQSQQGKRPTFSSKPISVAAAKKIATLNHVKSYNLYTSTQALASGFDPIKSSGDDSDNSSSSSNGGNNQGSSGGPGGSGGQSQGKAMTQADLSISGVLDSATSTDFEESTSTLTSGKAITSSDTSKNVALVEKTLAKANDWKIGDTFKIKSSDKKHTIKLKIIGIYTNKESSSDSATNFSFLNPYNKIYTPYTVANKLKGSSNTNKVDSAVYSMDDAKNIDSFVSSAKKQKAVNYSVYKLDANDTLYEQMVGPIENVASFAKMIVYVVSIAGALILALLIIMQVRARKYEMGVLLAIGEKRSKLVAQFFIELLIVAILAFAVSAVSSHYIAQFAGDKLLDNQNSSQTTSQTSSQQNGAPGGGGGMGAGGTSQQTTSAATQTSITSLDVTISLGDLVKMGLIGIGITFFAVAIPAIFVLRLNPKEILTKQE